jgi:mono/diheme cytochrome c family protein
MKGILRWLRLGFLSIVLLLVVAGAIVYLLSERVLRRTYTEPRVDILVPLGEILAYLRSVSPRPGPAPERRLGPVARLAFVVGQLRPAAQLVRRATLVTATWPKVGESTAPGGYLARTSCTECHGLDLRGGDAAPDLRIAAGYSFEGFTGLMRGGKALGNRELPLMSSVARGRFSHFTERELLVLYTYLVARAAMPDSTTSSS